MGRKHYQAVGMIEVAGNLPGSVGFEFVKFSLGEVAEIFEAGGGPQFGQTLPEPVRTLRPEGLHGGAVLVGSLEKLAVAEGYVHKSACDKLFSLPIWFMISAGLSISKHQPGEFLVDEADFPSLVGAAEVVEVVVAVDVDQGVFAVEDADF